MARLVKVSILFLVDRRLLAVRPFSKIRRVFMSALTFLNNAINIKGIGTSRRPSSRPNPSRPFPVSFRQIYFKREIEREGIQNAAKSWILTRNEVT